ERGIDLSRPLYLHAYGEWTKREGVARVMPGRPGAQRFLWGDAGVQVRRARDADRFVWTRQTFTEFPDYWTDGAAFQAPLRLTDANPQQREYAWSPGTRLVNYVSDKGDSLQAALFLPAGYQEGQSYPTTVYIYEKLSQSLHQYATPNETRALNPSVYTSRGMAVLMPDIVYKLNDPGMSAVWTVLPAVKAAAATGVVDISKVGLHGHSWGGYQTAFLVTQTDMFASAVAGAALTDMVSMYSSVYWNSGGANQAIFETSQGRFLGNFIDNYDAYIRNSPAFHANKIKTPLLLLHNEKDGAVDFNQGITYYNTLRELGKDVILLQYVGENHGLALPRNQKDYRVRMGEWFGHYLLGQEAPDWMKDGIPRLKMEEHLKARQQAAKPVLVP
ncbi:MAG: prolyl oligopeptidase family serine peptidase, partial [Gemmatimonadota bacterium]|nr:prolyl oligopeptidase family serine peptidase [Gemmatimonadota bacterium]